MARISLGGRLVAGCMSNAAFAHELAMYGPGGAARALPLSEARAYCRRLARTHYENFTVASWLLPRALRPHFYHVYAYCRWADDLADETADKQQSLDLLNWWEDELEACYAGNARHPVFRALAETIERFEIPRQPFKDLLVAFRQDQQVNRYDTFEQLLQYCRYSANPVGQLVLYLARSHTPDRVELSDRVCTGLQLANFWQDVKRDWQRGRIYIPQESCVEFGYDAAMFRRREYNPAFRAMLAREVDRAEQFLRAGLPLVERMPRALSSDVWLFIHGGLKILHHVRRLDYNVWACRPKVTRREQWRLLAGFLRTRLVPARSAHP